MKRQLVAALALLLTVNAVSAQQARTVTDAQRLAMYSKPSVVRVLEGYVGSFYSSITNRAYPIQYIALGSGFFIDPNGYIATNAHVVNMTKEGEEKGRQFLIQQFLLAFAESIQRDPRSLTEAEVNQILQSTQLQSFQAIRRVVIPDGTSLPFEIKSFGAPVGQGKDVAIIKIETKNAPILKIGDSDQLQLQDHVTVIGYPGAADTFDSGILDDKSALEASITDGRISAKKATADGAPILQVSAVATHGNSGGPVLNDQGEVIGLLTFGGDRVGGQEIQGFTFVVASNTLKEFVKQAGATNEPGLIDSKYREGLALYWDGKYSKAIQKFEEVNRLFSSHSEASKLIRASQQAIAEGKERKIPTWAIVAGAIGIALVGFLLMIGVVVFVVKKMRGGDRAPQPAYQPNYGQPQPAQPQPPYGGGAVPSAGRQPVAGPPMTSDRTVMVSRVGALVCTSGALSGQRFELPSEGVYIGRDAGHAQIIISDSRVSKRHVWIGPKNGGIAAVDQGSTNGTFLNTPNSQRINEVQLRKGDTLIVSDDVARFQIE